MSSSSKPQHRKPQKIAIEELIGAAGMSGFGALIGPQPAVAVPRAQPWAETRVRFSLRAAALAENLGRQNEVLRSLKEPLARRARLLERAVTAAVLFTTAISRSSHAADGDHGAHPGRV
jgi:hypothetical protein